MNNNINKELTQMAMQIFGQENFQNMAQKFESMSEQERQNLFRTISPMQQNQLMQFFQSKGLNISQFMNGGGMNQMRGQGQNMMPMTPTPRKFNY